MNALTDNGAPTILALVDNLFFASKIEAAVRNVSLGLTFARNEDEFRRLVSEQPPAVIIVDMAGNTAWEPLVRELKAHPSTASVPVLAFGRHTHAELFKQARKAGCDKAITNAQLSENLPALLGEYVGP